MTLWWGLSMCHITRQASKYVNGRFCTKCNLCIKKNYPREYVHGAKMSEKNEEFIMKICDSILKTRKKWFRQQACLKNKPLKRSRLVRKQNNICAYIQKSVFIWNSFFYFSLYCFLTSFFSSVSRLIFLSEVFVINQNCQINAHPYE